MKSFTNRILPFLILGIILVILVAGIILLSYLIVFGAIVGLILFAAVWLKEKLFPTKDLTRSDIKQGRTINHDEIK